MSTRTEDTTEIDQHADAVREAQRAQRYPVQVHEDGRNADLVVPPDGVRLVRVDVYTAPKGDGWVATYERAEGRGVERATRGEGPETWRVHDWQEYVEPRLDEPERVR